MSILERVLLAEVIMSVKDLVWALAFLEYGVNDVNSIYFSSFLISFGPQSPLWPHFLGPKHESLKGRPFLPLPLRVTRALNKLNCFPILSPVILVLLQKFTY